MGELLLQNSIQSTKIAKMKRVSQPVLYRTDNRYIRCVERLFIDIWDIAGTM
jgi:hypothetical protein